MSPALLLILTALLLGAGAGVLLVTSRRTPTPAAVGTAPAHAGNSVLTAKSAVVGVYNIHTGRGLDGKLDLKRIARVIESSEADAVSLHEVKAAFAGRPDQASSIAGQLGFGCLFSPSRQRWLRDYRGNALISRAAIGPWRREPLVDDTGKNFRILTTTAIDICGVTVPLLFTHLHTRGLRDDQLRTVFDRFRATGPGPAILMGDLNVKRTEAVMCELLNATPNATDAIHTALKQDDPNDRVDWIITRGLEVTQGGVKDAGASDHPFYWVSLETSR